MDRCMDGRMDGWMDGQGGEKKKIYIYTQYIV